MGMDKTAAMEGSGQLRRTSTTQNEASHDRDLEPSLSDTLLSMQLEDSIRASRVTGAAAVDDDLQRVLSQEEADAVQTPHNHNNTQLNSPMKPSSDSEYVPSQEREADDVQRPSEEHSNENSVEEHVALKYQIPEDELRAAMLAPPQTRASYWGAKLYRGPKGQPVSTHYCKSLEVAERVAQKFTKEKVLGFDIEWKPFGKPSSIKENASLIQLASEDRIALFHISLFAGDTPEQLMPPTLRAVLESADILKVGVAVKGDFGRLQKFFNIQAQGVFELSRLHNLVEYHATEPDKLSNKLYKLAGQVLQHLQLPLYKGEQLEDDLTITASVRESDWSKPLDLQQIQYAASDAYAGFRLYHMLEWKRKQLRPTPPTRGLCDYDSKPLPRSKAPRKRQKAGDKSKLGVATTPEQVIRPLQQSHDQIQDLDQGAEEEDDVYETAAEELIDDQEPQDLEVGAGIGNDLAHKRIGRVNLSWLRSHGPDPGYPALPCVGEEADDRSASSLFCDHSSRLLEDVELDPLLSDPRPNGSVQETTDDEFADPDLEEALNAMEVDMYGKLKEDVGTAITATSDQSNTSCEFDELPTDSPPTFQYQPLAGIPDTVVHTREYTLAATWAQTHLHSTVPSPASTTPSRIRATVPHLRAYYLWFYQELSVDEIARHLRDPPLSHNTVTGYILQAVSLERLEYDKSRMKELVTGLPTALKRGTWKWMAEKVGAL
jgi:hypothetical protein